LEARRLKERLILLNAHDAQTLHLLLSVARRLVYRRLSGSNGDPFALLGKLLFLDLLGSLEPCLLLLRLDLPLGLLLLQLLFPDVLRSLGLLQLDSSPLKFIFFLPLLFGPLLLEEGLPLDSHCFLALLLLELKRLPYCLRHGQVLRGRH